MVFYAVSSELKSQLRDSSASLHFFSYITSVRARY